MTILRLSQAHPDERTEVIELLTEVSAWLVERGISQWPSPPPPGLQRFMAREISAGQVYLARLLESDEVV